MGHQAIQCEYTPGARALAVAAPTHRGRKGTDCQYKGSVVSSTFDGVANAVVSATVTNTGDETVRVLNRPGTVLSKGGTDAFSISSSAGQSPRFKGIFAKYIPGPHKSFTTLEPGQSVIVEHSLGDAYDFSKSGAGTYSIEPSPKFYVVSADGGVNELTADVSPHSATLSGALSPATTLPNALLLSQNCSASALDKITAAAAAADGLVHDSAHALLPPSNAVRYTTWFGEFAAARYARVLGTFARLLEDSFLKFGYTCLPADLCEGLVDSIAFTMADTKFHIWVCPAFFDLPLVGKDSQAGLLVHLATHWTDNGKTGHWAEGQEDCKILAKNWPNLAVDNSDSYEYFAENTPAL